MSSAEPEVLMLSELLANPDKIIVHPPKPCLKGGQICNVTYRDSRTPLYVQIDPPTPVRFNADIRTTDWKQAPCAPNMQIQKSMENQQELVTDLAKLTTILRHKLFEHDFDGKHEFEGPDDPMYKRMVQNLVYIEKKQDKREKYGEQPHLRLSVNLKVLPLEGENAVSKEVADEALAFGALKWNNALYQPTVEIVSYTDKRLPLNVLRRSAMTLDIIRIGYIHIGESRITTNLQAVKEVVFNVPSEERQVKTRDFSQYISQYADSSVNEDDEEAPSAQSAQAAPTAQAAPAPPIIADSPPAKRARLAAEAEAGAEAGAEAEVNAEGADDGNDGNDSDGGVTML